MNTYKIYYQWCGKKFVQTVQAKNKYDAEGCIIDLLQIDKVKLERGVEPEIKKPDIDDLMSAMGMK